MTTPSLRVYPFYICPAAQLGLVPYQNHIKPIYGPYMGHPHSKNWTLDFEPAFSPRFSFPLSPRSIFQTAQRFLLPNHVTSGLGDVTSGSGHVTSRHVTSGHVTSGEPAILPQRFEPKIHFSDWSAVSPSKSRDFPLHEPAIPFYHLVSGFPS